MRFLIDAQLPFKFAQWLQRYGHDSRHTLDPPAGNQTTDAELVTCALAEGRIVITKDSDFVQTLLLTDQPRLLLVSTGNVANVELERC